MRLHTGLLLPLLASAASAIPDAKVYLFQDGEWSKTSNPPTLSPEEARLVFAQRLGVSQYHSLADASEDALSYINQFGGHQDRLFEAGGDEKTTELLLFVDGVSAENAESLAKSWSSVQPAFTIANPPSSNENAELLLNLERQLGPDMEDCSFEGITSRSRQCWDAKSKITHTDLASDKTGMNFAKKEVLGVMAKDMKMNVMAVFMPESSWSIKSNNSYGSYEKVSQKQLGRRAVAEEPITEAQSASTTASETKQTASAAQSKYIKGVAPLCYTTLESCISSTNSCSGHGDCYKKTNGTSTTPACFACQCKPQQESSTRGDRTYKWVTHWGGGACQKKDVSAPFWLLAGFTIAIVAVMGWSIGMLYSIGEEKLPGVIGAGVSSKTT